MRRVFIVVIVLGLGMPARSGGGIYNFAEPPEKFGTYEEFKESLVFLRQINSTLIETPHRRRYLMMAELAELAERRGVPAAMDDLERLNLSGYLLRLNKSNTRLNDRLYLLAAATLQPLVRRDPKNFLAQSNL